MAQVTVEIDPRALRGFLRNLQDGPGQFVRITVEVMRKAMKLGEVMVKENLTRRILFPRTGRLRASIKGEVVIGTETSDGGGGVTGRLGILKPKDGKVLVYGGAQERGAEAVPTAAKVMTIPLKAALTASGVPRFTALQSKQIFDRTFWWNDILYGVKSGGGKKRKRNRLGEAKGTRRDQIIPLFMAATRVKIGGGPGVGRRYIREAVDRLRPDINKALQIQVTRLFTLRKQHGN